MNQMLSVNQLYPLGLISLALVLTIMLGLTTPTYGQYPVQDDAMVQKNQETLARHAFEQLVERFAILDFTREMMKHLQASEFEWRDAQELAIAVEALMSEPTVLSYTRDDIQLLFEEAYPGFRPVADWAGQQEAHARQVLGTHRAILLLLAEDQERWDAQQERLRRLKSRIDGIGKGWGSIIAPLLPDVAPRQKLMELRANARSLAQQETLLLREAMLSRSLLYNLQNATGPDAKARELALTERAIGIASP